MIDDIKEPKRQKKSSKLETISSHKPKLKGRRAEAIETVYLDNEEKSATNSPSDIPTNKNPIDKTLKESSKKLSFWKKWSKKAKIIAILSTGLVLIASSIVLILITKQNPTKTEYKAISQTSKPKPEIFYSDLSGLKIGDKSINERPVIGVMIENSTDARPQSGLSDAGVVFEAIAEGGITRFLALYQDSLPNNIGPVRSARPYFVSWNQGFNASLAHVGGSPEALQNIKDWKVKDMDQFSSPGPYRRISSRYAPHNMYSTLDGLMSLSKSKGFTESNFSPFERKKEDPATKITAKNINLQISSANFNVNYSYDSTSNSYKRFEGGAPHIDNNTSKQLSPKSVIALITDYKIDSDGIHSRYQTLGSGQVVIFQDGTITEGTWHKDGLESNLIFKDQTGNIIKLNRGQTWITALSGVNRLNYNAE